MNIMMLNVALYNYQPLPQRIRDIVISIILLIIVLWIFRKRLNNKEPSEKDRLMDSKTLERLYNNDTTDNHIYWYEEPTLISYSDIPKGKILTYEIGHQEDVEASVLINVKCLGNQLFIDKNENDVPIASYMDKHTKIEIEISDRYADLVIDMATDDFDNLKTMPIKSMEK